MEKVVSAHNEEFSSPPDIVLSAPGRFHLVGEHSWYFKDKTLSMAVNLPVYLAISKRPDSSLRFYFPQTKERKRANITSLKYRREDRWANNVKALMFAFVSMGHELPGMNVTVYSDILPSAGFGITTAIKVATALALRTLFSLPYDDKAIMDILEKANRVFLSTEHYVSDLNAALFAKKNTCILTDHKTKMYKTIPFPFKDHTIVLTDARVPRISLWDEETIRREEYRNVLKDLEIRKNGDWVYEDSEAEIADVLSDVPEDVRRRLICVMKEHQYVVDAVEGLETKDFSKFARAVNKSHEIMRDLYQISCPEIDWLVKRVLEFDSMAIRKADSCARITGKGFGRCTYTIIKNEDVETYMQKLSDYERIFGFHPVTYIVKPVDGAAIQYPYKKP